MTKRHLLVNGVLGACAVLAYTEAYAEKCNDYSTKTGSLAAFKTPADAWADCEGTACPILEHRGTTYVAFADNDNELKVIVVGYDTAGKQVFRLDKPGTRYVRTISFDCPNQSIVFASEQSSIKISMREFPRIVPVAPPPPLAITKVSGTYCRKAVDCPVKGGGKLYISGTGITASTVVKGVSGPAVVELTPGPDRVVIPLPAGKAGSQLRIRLANGNTWSDEAIVAYAPPLVISRMVAKDCQFDKAKLVLSCNGSMTGTLSFSGSGFESVDGAHIKYDQRSDSNRICQGPYKTSIHSDPNTRYCIMTGTSGTLKLQAQGGNVAITIRRR